MDGYFRRLQLDVVSKLKSLGIQFRCARRMANDVAEGRVRKGITISRRIRWTLLQLQTKASLIACLVGPAAMYGFSAGGFTPRLVSSLRTAVVAALRGTKCRSRCREIVLTLFVKGHLVDPLQNARDREMSDGPVATTHSILQGMGWHWQTPTLFMREGRSHLGLPEGPESWSLHEIRQGLRFAEWRQAGNKRNDMRGIESRSVLVASRQ